MYENCAKKNWIASKMPFFGCGQFSDEQASIYLYTERMGDFCEEMKKNSYGKSYDLAWIFCHYFRAISYLIVPRMCQWRLKNAPPWLYSQNGKKGKANAVEIGFRFIFIFNIYCVPSVEFQVPLACCHWWVWTEFANNFSLLSFIATHLKTNDPHKW